MVKTLVEHIRTVHFSLLVLCLIMLSASPHQKDLDVGAYEEAQAVANNLNQEFLDQLAEDYLQKSGLGSLDEKPSESQQYILKPGEQILWHAFRNNSLDSYRAAWSAIVKASTGGSLDGRFFRNPWLVCFLKCTSTFTLPKEWTLSEVEVHLNNAHILVPRTEQAAIITAEPRRAVFPSNWNEGLPADTKCKFEVSGLIGNTSGEPDREFIGETSITCEGGGERAEWVTSFSPGIPVHMPRVDHLKEPSLSWRENAAWADDKSFRKTFPILAIEMNTMFNFTVAEAVSALKTRAESTPEAMQVFGAKVPLPDALLIFGVLILSCQFYLWAHTNELRRVLRSGPLAEKPTGFIGFYPGAVTAIMVGLTLTILPLATIIYVLERTIPFWLWKELPGTDFIAILTVAVSSGIGARTSVLMRGIRDMILAGTDVQLNADQTAGRQSPQLGD